MIDDAAVVGQQSTVARRTRQQVVKLDVEREIGLSVVALFLSAHSLDDGAQLVNLAGLDTLRGQAPDQALEHRTHFVDLIGLRQRDFAHEHTAVLLDTHQTGLIERTKGFTHRPPRNSEGLSDVGLVELGTTADLARDNASPNLALRQGGQ